MPEGRRVPLARRVVVRRAPVIHLLLLLCIAAYAALGWRTGGWWVADAGDLIRAGGAFAPALAGGEWWRLLSAIFLHGGVVHLAVNGIALRDIGPEVEGRDGPLRTLLVFLLAGAVGFAASSAWHPEVVSIGASGAILGLIGWWGVGVWRSPGGRGSVFRAARLRALGIYLALVFGAGLLVPGIDNTAHLAGLLTGTLLRLAALWQPGGRPWGLSVAVLAVALLLPAGLQLYPAEWSQRYAERQRFERIYAEFAAADRQVNLVLQAIGRESRAGTLSESEALRRMDAEVLPVLAENLRRWQDVRFSSPALSAEAGVWATYARVRLEALQALRRAVLTGDRSQVVRFETLMRDAAALAASSSENEGPPPPGQDGKTD